MLIIVDSYSKWIDVHVTSSTSATVTIDRLRQTFATHGLPLVVVTDNATAFTSSEFGTFMKGNGIKHMFSPPRHPASNGQAEALVKVVKNGIRKRTGSLHTRLQRFLLAYRSTPHSTTGQSPAELLFSRPLRTRLDLCKPNLRQSVELKQQNWKAAHDRGSVDRQFATGDPVYVCLIPGPGAPWEPGTIISADGQACTVLLTDGRTFTRHRDHIRHRVCGPPAPSQAPPALVTPVPALSAPAPTALEPHSAPAPAVPEAHPASAPEACPVPAPEAPAAVAPAAPVAHPALDQTPPRRSQRNRRAPVRLGIT